ncbi:MAG: IclR family transcriptional regulator, partial [Corynebacterium casei]|nr:IclR family transcriptional regulator [Corynebacterium casei]
LFRRRGWAEEIEEVSRGQRSVAVAIVDHLQRPAASLAVTYRADLADSDEAVDVAIAVLMKSAKSISKRMYGTKVDAQYESERLG